MNAARARHSENGGKSIRMNSMILGLGSNPSISVLFTFFLFACLSSVRSQIPIPVSRVEVFGVEGVDEVAEPLIWRRNLAEEFSQNSSMILAPKRTRRIDPLNDYKHYGGGWNISNKHYWASVGFTAAPFFVVAVVWFLLFGLCLFFVCLCYCCCQREPYGYSRTAYALSLIILIFFTISAIIGCIVLYTGQGKFHGGTTTTLDYVVSQADQTVETLGEVSDDLNAAKQIRVSSVLLPTDVQTKIDEIDAKINSASNTLSERTRDDSKKIQDVLEFIRKTLIILSAVMLLLAFLGFLFSILGLQCLVYSLVIIGWILVAGTFILCGVFLLLHNVVADTCVAMDEWVQNPTAHTALDDILPCVDNATAQETLVQSKNVTYQLVSVVNTVINNVANVDIPPNFGPPLYYNQSGPLIPVLCNPFNPDLTDRQCMADESQLNNASEIFKNFICQSSSSGICTTPGRLTATYYDQMAAAVNVSYGLYRYGPFLVNLIDCTFVRETFTDISNKNCPELRKYTEWIYIGLVMVSVAVMLSLIFWIIYARERRHRVYTKLHMAEATDEESKRP